MIIFSVFQKHYTREQNEQQHQGIVRWLKRVGVFFRETTGTYQGQEELGFAVHECDEGVVKTLCSQHSQECYLAVSKNKAFLIYVNGPLSGREIYAGVWTPGRGLKGDYTLMDGAYYHCE